MARSVFLVRGLLILEGIFVLLVVWILTVGLVRLGTGWLTLMDTFALRMGMIGLKEESVFLVHGYLFLLRIIRNIWKI
jgi:hypothetical protein